MKQKLTHPLFLITYGVTLYALFMNFRSFLQILKNGLHLISPVLAGLLIAFVLNVPMTGFERLLRKIWTNAKRPPPDKLIHGISLFLTFACILLVVILAITQFIPSLVESARGIYPLASEKWQELLTVLARYEIDTTQITEWLSGFDLRRLGDSFGSLFSSVVDAAKSTISSVVSAVFGLVIAVYLLLSKSVLGPQTKKMCRAYLKETTAERVFQVAALVRDTYARFLSGQCVEAILLGALMATAFSIARLPYAVLSGFMTAIFAFVPYIGAFASFLIAAVLVLLAAPSKILLCVAIYPTVQFIENQFIYPHVVGGSVGLSPLWTLIAALIGGKLFGIVGIIFFIPLAAVVYALFRDDVNRRLERKKEKPEKRKM